MDKVTVKLSNPDSIFWDQEQGEENERLIGEEEKELFYTTTVSKAITEGRLKVVSGPTKSEEAPEDLPNPNQEMNPAPEASNDAKKK